MAKHETLPPGALPLSWFAKKYDYDIHTLYGCIKRERLKAYRLGRGWYTTEKDMKRYLASRDLTRLPNKYKGKRGKY